MSINTQRSKLLINTLVAIAFLSLAKTSSAQFNEKFIESHSVRVIASANGEKSASSGFMWKTANQVVTSLHSIPAGSVVTVECQGVRQSASVISTYARADLILLKVEGLPSDCLPFTSFDSKKPPRNTTLWTFGYHAGARSLTDREFKKRYGKPERLDYLVSGKPLQAIKDLGYPATDLEIYYVQGGLLPGYSGGPVVNDSGNLVGIVDGGLNKGASAYNWVIPAENLDDLVASNLTTFPTVASDASNVLFSSGIADVEDKDVIEYIEEGRKFSWVLTKTQSLDELLSSADDAEGVGQLTELFAGSTDASVSAKMVFDIYEEQNQGLIIAVPTEQGLRYVDDGSDGEWLMSGSGAKGSGIAGSRYAYSDWDIENDTGDVIAPSNTDYYQQLITQLVIDCHNPGKSYCYLDEDTVRMIDFGQGNKILRLGVITDYYDTSTQPHYDYYSFAVRGNIPFGAQGQIPLQRNSALYKCLIILGGIGYDENACDNATVESSELAQLLAVHLTSFAGLSTNSDSKILNTQFKYAAENDSASTVFVPYYEQNEIRFFNSRGKEWRVYNGDDYELATESFRMLDLPTPSVMINAGELNYILPIEGGEYSSSDGSDWQVAGSVIPKRRPTQVEITKEIGGAELKPLKEYRENNKLRFQHLGGARWNVYGTDGREVVLESRREFNDSEEFIVLGYQGSEYFVPVQGGDYFISIAGAEPVSAGSVKVNLRD